MQLRRFAVPDALTVLLTGWLLWPQHAGGYGLGHDMVFTPHQALTAGSFGLGSASPRAVPLDALVSLVSRVLGGAATGRIALLVPLLLAGWGAARLAAMLFPARVPALLLVAGLAVWNPYVVERLALGQWALLWCYGALPWLIRAAHRCAERDSAIPGLVLALAAAAITPTGAVIGAVVAVVVAGPRRAVLVPAALVQLPWLLPALTSAAATASDPAAVAAFAARSERPGGPLLSLLGLGGIWNADVVPGSRGGVLGMLTTIAVLAGLVFGVRLLRPRALAVRLVLLAAVGLLLAVAGTAPVLAPALRWLVGTVPGAGLLRDGQKWLMPFVLLSVLAGGAGVNRGAERIGALADATRRIAAGVVLAVAAACLPLLLLPDGPATLRVPLTPVHYPAGWQVADDRIGGSDRAVLLLPFASYRSFGWAPGRTVLDPAPRLLRAPVVVDDRLAVGGRLLTGEDPSSARVAVLLSGQPDPTRLARALAGAGIGWVLVETGTPGPALPDLSALTPVSTGPGVQLFRVPGRIQVSTASQARRVLVYGADLLVALLVVLALAVRTRSAVRPLLHSRVTSAEES